MAKKILLVDDEPDVVKMLAYRIKHAGYDVVTALNGKEALDIVNKEPVDLIMLDMLMPVMDGKETSTKIKQDEKLKKIPVIILTASISTPPEELKKELKVEGVLIKPCDPEAMLNQIKTLIEKI